MALTHLNMMVRLLTVTVIVGQPSAPNAGVTCALCAQVMPGAAGSAGTMSDLRRFITFLLVIEYAVNGIFLMDELTGYRSWDECLTCTRAYSITKPDMFSKN